ncbi:phage portal protein [Senimuribacter intestinalis]|uniref:phage portal protein n=1 Tax=Senimuribacter intestinalis TaxID=2941507 RepID=UPI002042309B|nr:phage portal protein [Senimuribacter intestinalis]
MELEVMKNLIRRYLPRHEDFVQNAMIAERYYRNETDVLYSKVTEDEEETDNPLRNADNRIPRNFHGLLVNQKASYAFTYPPVFDVGSEEGSKKIQGLLGDEYEKNCSTLCVNAANCAVAWVHYWDNGDGFEWAVVDSKEIIPIFDNSLKKRLIGAMRVYNIIDEETGEKNMVYEYWTDRECQAFKRRIADTVDDGLHYYEMFTDPTYGEPVWWYEHKFEEVPFIPFWNNNIGTSDLKSIKPLIDVFDKVFSGFINDLDDVQELIFVLSGYGGTDLSNFLEELKKYKTVKVDADEGNPGISTLSIEIPIEARNSVLETTRKAIFEQGQGFDPQPENFGNQSGEALKFMYSLLEMKTGLMETEFRLGFYKLVRAICKHAGIAYNAITQTWYRNSIKNDVELAQICRDSEGIISKRTILKNHPFVEDPEEELQQLEKEEQESYKKMQQYAGAFGGNLNNDDDDVEG